MAARRFQPYVLCIARGAARRAPHYVGSEGGILTPSPSLLAAVGKAERDPQGDANTYSHCDVIHAASDGGA